MWFKKFILFFLFILCTFCCCANLGYTSDFSGSEDEPDHAIQERKHLVLGCGDTFKNETTIVGFPHDHTKETAITIDLVKENPLFKTADPTFLGNILHQGDDNIWSHFQDEQFEKITCECVPLYRTLEPKLVGDYMKSGCVPASEARQLATYRNWRFVMSESARILSCEGVFEVFPALHRSSYGAVLKGMAQEILNERVMRVNAKSTRKQVQANLQSILSKKYALFFTDEKQNIPFQKCTITFSYLNGDGRFNSFEDIEAYEYSIEEGSMKMLFCSAEIQLCDERFLYVRFLFTKIKPVTKAP